MKILYITAGFPYPLTTGYLRHYFLIRELAQRHSITLLSVVDESFSMENVRPMQPFTERVMTFVLKNSSWFNRKVLSRVRMLTWGEKPVREMRAAMDQLLVQEKYDAMFYSGKLTFPAIKGLTGLPLVVDMCDATSVRMRGNMRVVAPVRRIVKLIGYLHTRRVEQALIDRASHMLFASCRDRDALVGRSREHTSVVPNGVDIEFWKRTTHQRGANRIVFTGAMNYPPNTDAGLYMIDEILPRVRARVPAVQLTIVGRDPPPEVRAAGERAGVHITGFVDDVRPYLEEATVFAAPLRFGAGIQNKVLESMAMELPVVTSSVGADGLRTEEGDCPPLDVADDPAQFAEAVVRHLLDRDRDPSPVAAAREYVERHFVWKQSGQKLEEVLQKVVAESRGLRPPPARHVTAASVV